jgi:hypothetical protein
MKRTFVVMFLFLVLGAGTVRAANECDLIIGREVHAYIAAFPAGERQAKMDQYLSCLRTSVDRALKVLYNSLQFFQEMKPGLSLMGTYYMIQGAHENLKSTAESTCYSAGAPGSLEYGYCLVDAFQTIKAYYKSVEIAVKKIL